MDDWSLQTRYDAACGYQPDNSPQYDTVTHFVTMRSRLGIDDDNNAKWFTDQLQMYGGQDGCEDVTGLEYGYPLTLNQKMSGSVVALLYLIWPGLCSETFALFACRSLCGDTDKLRLRVDLTELCFEGTHGSYA